MPKYTKAKYPVSQALLMERASVFLGFLEEHIDAFTTFDSTINSDFVNDFRTAVNNAKGIVSDNVIGDRLAQLSEDVKHTMKDCQKLVTRISYFVKNCFADNMSVQQKFGFGTFRSVRYVKDDLIQYMKELHTVTDIYRVELTAEGMQESYIDDCFNLYESLQNYVQKQDLYKGERRELTSNRIKAYNEIWKFMVKISKAADIVFADNYSLRNLFKLPQRKASRKKKNTDEHSENIPE